MVGFYSKLMGSSFVYDHVRPKLLGGFDFSIVYNWLETTEEDVVIDIGCGGGEALEYFPRFKKYCGFDVDGDALTRLREKYRSDRIHTRNRALSAADVAELCPSKVIMVGILHHLKHCEIRELVGVLGGAHTVRRMVTLDPVYRPGRRLSNFLAKLDRGHFVRNESGYRQLFEESPFAINDSAALSSGNGIAKYFAMSLAPR